MSTLSLRPTHKAVADYYEALGKFEKLGVKHEGAVRSAFEALLQHCARQVNCVLVTANELKRKGARSLSADGAIVDSLSRLLRYGVWETKDSDDDLENRARDDHYVDPKMISRSLRKFDFTGAFDAFRRQFECPCENQRDRKPDHDD